MKNAGRTDQKDGCRENSGKINSPFALNVLLQTIPDYIVCRGWMVAIES
jgi:hypothetical protein